MSLDPKNPANLATFKAIARGEESVTPASSAGSDQRMLAADLEQYRVAPSGVGELAPTWSDKPHWLVYDLVAEVKRLTAALSEAEAERDKAQALVARLEQVIVEGEALHRQRYVNLREALDVTYPTAEEIVGCAIAAIHERNDLRAALRERDAELARLRAGLKAIRESTTSQLTATEIDDLLAAARSPRPRAERNGRHENAPMRRRNAPQRHLNHPQRLAAVPTPSTVSKL